MVEVGQPAPDITLRGEDDTEVKLSDFRGQNVVMFRPQSRR